MNRFDPYTDLSLIRTKFKASFYGKFDDCTYHKRFVVVEPKR